MKINAYVARGVGQMALETVELDEPKSTEIRVKLVACGVCHTDAAAMAAIVPVSFPAVLGHEGAGIVDAVGSGVRDFKVGDRVLLSFPSCGICRSCRKARPYACTDSHKYMFGGVYLDGKMRIHKDGEDISSFFGQGSFAEYSIVDERNAVKVDVENDSDLAVLTSLGCGIQTGAGSVLNRMEPKPGSSIAIFGCGAVGMAAIMAAKIAGCSTIIGVDAVPERLALAKELGATHVINGKEVDAVVEIRSITEGTGADYSLECSGSTALAYQAIDCLAVEGMNVLVSVTGAQELTFKPEPMMMTPCRTFTGLVEGGSNPKVFIPKLVQFYREGKLPVDKLVKTYSFDQINEAFEDSHSGKVIKPVLMF